MILEMLVVVGLGKVADMIIGKEPEREDPPSLGSDYEPLDYRGIDASSKGRSSSSSHQTKLSDYE